MIQPDRPEPTGTEPAGHAGVRTHVDLPADAVVMSVVEVCNYIDSEGASRYGVRVGGGETYVHAMGMLQFASNHLHEMQMGRTD